MFLFLVLNIGSILYALFISVFQWNIRSGAGAFIGIANYQNVLTTRSSIRAIQNSLYYAVIWVPLDDGGGPVPRRPRQPEAPRPDLLPGGVLLPGDRLVGRDHVLWIFLAAPDGLFNEVREALGLNPLFQLLGYTDNQNWIGNANTALNSVILLNAWTTSGTFMLFYLALAPDDPRRGLRGGRDRRRRHVADVLAGSPSRCSSRATSSWRRWRSSARSSCSTRPGSPAAPTGDPANALMTVVLYLYNLPSTSSTSTRRPRSG